VPSEERLRKQFGIKECRVILLNIQPLSVKGSFSKWIPSYLKYFNLLYVFFLVTNMENTKQLPPNKEADPIADYGTIIS